MLILCYTLVDSWYEGENRTDDITLMAESEEELKSLLTKVKEERGKIDLKFSIQKMNIMAFGHITSWQIDGKNGNSDKFYFPGLQNHCRWWPQPWNLKTLAPWEKSYDQHIKQQSHHFADKDPSSQSYGFSSSHVWIWELDYKEGWVWKNWCFWTVVFGEDSWESLGLQGDPTSPS